MISREFDNAQRFSSRAEYYAAYRPAYPDETIEYLRTEAGLDSGAVIVDVGSGTGLSSSLFLRHGHIVHGVEPSAEMRWEAERLLGRCSGFQSVDGTAERTTLPDECADAVVAASAIHGFDPDLARAEFRRILRPGGMVVVMGNGQRNDSSLLMEEYDRIVRDHSVPRWADENREERVRPFLASNHPIRTCRIEYTEELTFRMLRGRTLSYSRVPLPGHPGYHAMMRDLRMLFDAAQTGDVVRFDTQVRIYWTRLEENSRQTRRELL